MIKKKTNVYKMFLKSVPFLSIWKMFTLILQYCFSVVLYVLVYEMSACMITRLGLASSYSLVWVPLI